MSKSEMIGLPIIVFAVALAQYCFGFHQGYVTATKEYQATIKTILGECHERRTGCIKDRGIVLPKGN